MDTATENAELIEEMMRRVEKAEEPGLPPGTVVHRGNNDVPTPGIIGHVSSAGYVWVYDTKTGAPSKINMNMLHMQLKKRHEDGSLAFTVHKPAFDPPRGECKCMLHPDNEERSYYDSLGLPVCQSAHLRNPYEVQQHMKKRHPKEWATLESIKRERERQEDRDFQKALLGAAKGATEAPLYVSEKKKK